MKTINRLFGFLVLFLIGIGNSYSAASAVVYPFSRVEQLLSKSNLSLVPDPAVKSIGTRTFFTGGVANIAAESNSFPALGAAASEAIAAAVTLKGPIEHALAKRRLIGAVAGGVLGVGVTYLASLGIDYLQGQWTGVIQAATWCVNGYCADTATQACAAYYTAYTDYPTAGYSCNANGDASLVTDSGPNCCQAFTYGGGGITIRGWSPTQQSAAVSGPITQEQAEQIAESSPITPTDSDYQAMLDAGWALPIGQTSLEIDLANLTSAQQQYLQEHGYIQPTPDSISIKNGQPVTDPLTGQKSQPMVQLEPAPNQGVRLTPYQTPLDANGQPATDAQGNPLPPTQAQFDPCELNPDRAGCANLGTPEAETITPTAHTVTGQFNEFNISGTCPSDKSFSVGGMTHTIQMAPICGAAENYIKPFLLLMASVTAYFIFVGGLRT